ncbi:hypothetical protein J2Z60_001048 [Lactobacillus colini]|uniref:DUF4097 domain-containing protein n=1 Tax=Lactobacillus colini TaxID=1819254 RepID=A0ABS4MDW5_9LACO|nr:DUF4097 family beta strand repeat-containing protein [Lactobacillus colini]MBP2057876.1 hypothetical protein [Lactobacillus colini]
MLDDKIKQIFNNYPARSDLKQLEDAIGLKLVNESKLSLTDIDEIHFNYRLGDLLILPSPDLDQLIVRDLMSRDISKLYSTVEKVGNVIKVTQGPKKLVGLFKNKVIILLPASYTGFLTIRSQSGDVSFSSLDQDCLLDVTAISGDVHMLNSNVARLQADLKSGDINLSASQISDCHINTQSGDITASDVNIDDKNGEMALSATSGKINLANISTKRLLITSHSGNIKILVPDNLQFKFLISSKSGNIILPMDAIIYAEDNYNPLRGYVGSQDASSQLDITSKSGNIKILNVNNDI